MNENVRGWAKICVTYHHSKVIRHTRTLAQPFLPRDSRLDHVPLNIVRPLQVSRGLGYPLTCEAGNTRWHDAVLLVDTKAALH